MADALVYLKIFVAIFVLVNPLEGIPVFLAQTQNMPDASRHNIARIAAIGVTVILLVALFIGSPLLAALSISIGAFTTAGGIIIFLVALQMVSGAVSKSNAVDDQTPDFGERFALVPLATPLLAGPGPISSAIVYASKGPFDQGCTLIDYVILAGIILVVGVATWGALRAADQLRRLLGATGIEVSTRISGILVAAIAVQMIHDGLVRLFPELVSAAT